MWYQKEAGGIFLCLNIKRDEYEQQQATPCTCGRFALYVVELLSNLRSVTHHIYLLELCSSYMLHVFVRTWFRTSQALLKFRQYN